jgi:transposase
MFTLTSSYQYYFYAGATDMRKGFDGLCGLVHHELGRRPMTGEVFVFVNRQRDKIKLLHWEQGGFVLYYKRLERGTFEVPKVKSGEKTCQITWSLLMLMIEGIMIEKSKQRRRFFINNPALAS